MQILSQRCQFSKGEVFFCLRGCDVQLSSCKQIEPFWEDMLKGKGGKQPVCMENNLNENKINAADFSFHLGC